MHLEGSSKKQSAKAKRIKGIRLQYFNLGMTALALITFIVLIFSTMRISVRYDTLVSQTQVYLACESDAVMLREASDYLTEQVRLFVERKNVRYMEAYFNEVNVNKRREKALESLTFHNQDPSAEEALYNALNSSNELMKREIYAMKLAACAQGIPESSLPAEIVNTKLSRWDEELFPVAKLSMSRNLVFDETYLEKKEEIDTYLDQFLESVLNTLEERQKYNENELGNVLAIQRVLIVILFIINLMTYVAIMILVARPLRIYIRQINDNKTLDVIGSYEFKYLALTYNDIFELHTANERKLAHKAEHDPLTGILNRRAFDDLRELLSEKSEPMTLILIDVDHFKEINDQYGHEVGDCILQKVARILSGNFRSDDFIVRLGGDEFVVVAVGIWSQQLNLIERKFNKINDQLKNPNDNLPPVSLSVGAASSDTGFNEELYRNADTALYEVKKRGRCGFMSYVK